ncbi:flagellar basal body-associated FliL family protein [Oceanobacter mangrovi]|uniref:flagellar basal body-associated FliL family protein n=1 Tax=Oceanobacter mangrovi TaxID=2862510 RepID=UPI001C8EBE5C|nr:flagellar basal body-associated FliL family protein [Oceanobacter mangrovi]
MADEQDLKFDGSDEGKGKKGKLKLIIIIVVALLVLGGGGAAAWFFLLAGDDTAAEESAAVAEEAAKPEEPAIPAVYVMLKPEFIVSYQVGPRQRYLQLSIEVMTRKQTVVDALTLHEPMIRNEILRALGEQEFESLRTNEGRLALQQAIYNRITQTLSRVAQTAPADVESVLFTNFVMQ